MERGKAQLQLDFAERRAAEKRVVVFDLETQKSADEVGGWKNTRLMRVAVGIAHDSAEDNFKVFYDDDVPKLIKLLKSADIVVGYNSRSFDYGVLKGYTDEPLETALPTLDILEKVERSLGFRTSLDSIASATLGSTKSADGMQSLRWYKEGRLDLITEYCTQDVRITREVYLYGLEKGHLFFFDRSGKKKRFDVNLNFP